MRLYERQPGGTIDRARQLRRAASGPERRLLRAVREAFPSLKWRHQVPIGPYYVDILCFAERLVIEVDGDTHAHFEDHDATRTRFIERQGYRVIRVGNPDVVQNLSGVLARILLVLQGEATAPRLSRIEGGTNDEGAPV
jgi:very-short-patch-repair endonuclease